MRAFLLTWKPHTESEKGWPLPLLQELVRKVEEFGTATEPWRVANKKDSRVGDRVFLIRQGRTGLALIGYGHIKALVGDRARQLIEFQRLVDPEREVLVWGDELKRIPNSARHWRAQSSGTILPPHVALAIERMIREVDNPEADQEPDQASTQGDAEFLEGLRVFRFHRRVERRRNSALVQEVKRRHGHKCQACGFIYSDRYGSIGADYIDAHHLVPLHKLKGDNAKVMDPTRDFAVLCANCHRMIHKMGCPTLAEFRRVLRGLTP